MTTGSLADRHEEAYGSAAGPSAVATIASLSTRSAKAASSDSGAAYCRILADLSPSYLQVAIFVIDAAYPSSSGNIQSSGTGPTISTAAALAAICAFCGCIEQAAHPARAALTGISASSAIAACAVAAYSGSTHGHIMLDTGISNVHIAQIVDCTTGSIAPGALSANAGSSLSSFATAAALAALTGAKGTAVACASV
jgi:hypothetical protein